MTEKITLSAGDGSVTALFAQGGAGLPLLVCIPGVATWTQSLAA